LKNGAILAVVVKSLYMPVARLLIDCLFNPSFTAWVQIVPRRGIVVNSSRCYRVT